MSVSEFRKKQIRIENEIVKVISDNLDMTFTKLLRFFSERKLKRNIKLLIDTNRIRKIQNWKDMRSNFYEVVYNE